MKVSSSDYRPCLNNTNKLPDSEKSIYAIKKVNDQVNKFDKECKRGIK